MKAAIDAGDAASFNDYVDYPALKENIKGTINARLLSSASASKSRPRNAELGAALAAVMIGQMVEAFITPEAVAMMMKGERPSIGNRAGESRRNDPPVETSAGYESLNRFVLAAKMPGGKDQPIALVFRRDGLVNWKLVAMRMPE